MRYLLLLIAAFALTQAHAQPNCLKNSKLYYFDPNSSPRTFTEKLGNHPEFPFLQKINGVTSVQAFIDAINNPDNQKKYSREFIAFDLLLRNSGFTNGYKDIVDSSVEDMYIKRGTIGNLGFYDPQRDLISYIYVKLMPAGEDKAGVAAWKLTNDRGCYLYILHTCGNAFYPNNTPRTASRSRKNAAASGSCKMLNVQTETTPVEIQRDSFDHPVHIAVNSYQAVLTASKKSKSGYDTVVTLIHHMDTLSSFRDAGGKQLKVFVHPLSVNTKICKDTALKLYPQVRVDSVGPADRNTPDLVFSDTTYVSAKSIKTVCKNKWAITIDGGASFNTIPRFNDPTEHSQTNGAQLAGELAISRIFTPWFQVGFSGTYMSLSYQDDIAYPGSTPGTYNKVYLGDPIIPIQLFGKFSIGKEVGWRSNITLSIGYSLPMKGRIENSGTTLTTKPDLQSAPTAGLKLGIDYFFTCKFGIGVAARGQYFGNKGALINYSLFAFPITGGLRFRF